MIGTALFPPQKALKSEVLDERGRPQRFHGAFTGGFSAGHFNTVGTVEGWKPSTYHSSRNDRAAPVVQSMAQFADEEDDELGGATLAPTLAYDTQGTVGMKRGREAAAASAASTSSSSSSIPGPIPSEWCAPTIIPVGARILAALGVRAPTVTTSSSSSSSTSDAQAEEQRMAELFKEGTRRPPGCSFLGVGFDSGSLRQRTGAQDSLARSAAATASSSSSSSSSAAGGGGGLGTRRLFMAHAITSGMEYSEGGGVSSGGIQRRGGGGGMVEEEGDEDESEGQGLTIQPGKGVVVLPRLLLPAIMGGEDEEGEDDAGVYRQPSLKNFDIPLNAQDARAQLEQKQRQKQQQQQQSGSASGSGSSGNQLMGGLLKDAPSSSSLLLGLDGRPPLPGFHLATTRLDEEEGGGSLRLLKKYPTPRVPPGWVPKHLMKEGGEEEEKAQQQQQQQQQGRLGGIPSAPGPMVSATPAARAALEALFSKTKFVDASGGKVGEEGGKEGGELVISGVPPPLSHTLHLLLPKGGERCGRKEEFWLPSSLLLKRLGIKDPVSKEARRRIEEGGGVGGNVGNGSGSGGSGGGVADQGLPPAVAFPPMQQQQQQWGGGAGGGYNQEHVGPTFAPLFVDLDALLAKAIFGV